MSMNKQNLYDFDIHIAEIYDQKENDMRDVELLQNLLSNIGKSQILEPFCGTGRILIPLALDGHTIFGFDQSSAMVQTAIKKKEKLTSEIQKRIHLECGNSKANSFRVRRCN